MSDHPTIQRVKAFCEANNVSPVTVCGRAANNPRLWERLLRRLENNERDLAKLDEYINSASMATKRGNSSATVQEASSK